MLFFTTSYFTVSNERKVFHGFTCPKIYDEQEDPAGIKLKLWGYFLGAWGCMYACRHDDAER